jgi:hypothetical protein
MTNFRLERPPSLGPSLSTPELLVQPRRSVYSDPIQSFSTQLSTRHSYCVQRSVTRTRRYPTCHQRLQERTHTLCSGRTTGHSCSLTAYHAEETHAGIHNSQTQLRPPFAPELARLCIDCTGRASVGQRPHSPAAPRTGSASNNRAKK